MAQSEKQKISLKTVIRLLKYFSEFKLLVALFILSVSAGAILAIFAPQIIGDLINLITKNLKMTATSPKFTPDFEKIGELGDLLLAIYGISGILGYLQNWLMAKMAQTIVFNLRDETSKKISKLPLSYFDKRKTGDIVSVITNDVETISNNLGETINQVTYSLLTIVGAIIMMFRISFELSLVTFATGVISVGLIGLISKFSQVYFS